MMRAKVYLFVAAVSLVSTQSGFAAANQAQCTSAALDADAPATMEACAVMLRQPDLPTEARVRALGIRGVGFHRLMQYDSAIAEFEAAIALEPRNAKLKINAGLVALAKGDARKAAALAVEAVKLDPNSAAPFSLLGSALIGYGQFNAAKAAFDKALQLEPDNPQYRFRLFDLFVRLRLLREALQEADKLLMLPDKSISLFCHLRTGADVVQDRNANWSRTAFGSNGTLCRGRSRVRRNNP